MGYSRHKKAEDAGHTHVGGGVGFEGGESRGLSLLGGWLLHTSISGRWLKTA